MARAGFRARHTRSVASGLALAVAAGTLAAYAVTADGYRTHEARLHDGGIWVVNGDKGLHGRINKPINQLDGVVFDDRDRVRLDVVQDGASVMAIDVGAGRGRAVDASRLAFSDGGSAAIPAVGDVQMAGGTLASVDSETGGVWAVRVDSQAGGPLVSALDRQADPLEEVGPGASLAVSLAGTVVVTSAEQGTVTTLAAEGSGLGDAATVDLPGSAGSPSATTTVGERVVTLDAATGRLAVLDGAGASVPAGSVLQQPGPEADAVLVASPSSLLSVDLDSGRTSVVTDHASGDPVEPVRLGACTYGAWGGGLGAVAVQCGTDPPRVSSLAGKATSLAFRVNRGEIVLNDATSGTVWDVTLDTPETIDNWNAFTAKDQVEEEDEQDEQQSEGDRRPPKAEPDSYGVRPGRTTVLHPLDNDSAPDGRLLSIVSVEQPTGSARASISPDGQTIQLVVPDEARATSFDYTVDDGRTVSASATVTVSPRRTDQNAPPAPRKGYRPRVWNVPAGGALSVPVLADWRDDADGDPLVLDSAQALGGEDTGALARTTAEGRVRFTAPPDGGGLVKVQYGVSDGRSAPVTRTLAFQVQAPLDRRAFPPVAEPDVVRGEVGKPIEVRPLANDLPGSDPTTPQAELALGGKLVEQGGTTVRTDVERGVVRFTADRVGTYFLDYDAAYGNAPLSSGTIRVDVRQPAEEGADPVAMPDTVTLYGQTPGLVDVLANDLDPAGGLLVVQSVRADRAGELDLAVVDGRWLRISARTDPIAPDPQVVRYTVSNGTRSVVGEVTVSQREVPSSNAPVTTHDTVTVRAGTSVTAAVLDNDLSPSGDRLALLTDLTETPGELEVVPPMDHRGDAGRAFVAGRTVRYVAPRTLRERDTFEVRYAAVNTSGESSPGLLRVTVVPQDAPNTAPEPPTLEARVVAHDVVEVRLPSTSADAEGDPVSLTGITSAPRLGRLLSFTAGALRYQAYPGARGTDEFTYAASDARGAVATGTVRVGVVAPSTPQPPLAVDDVLTVQPGRLATFDPVSNDHVAPGEDPRLTLVGAPEGVRLDEETGLVTVPAPASLEHPAVQVVYSLSNGLDESRATMTLKTAADVDNPPVAYDAFGAADDSDGVVVDVLEGAYDPDGPADDLRVVEVYGDTDVASHTASKVKAVRGPEPRVVPFRVEDGAGSSALASLFVPPTGTGLPYVRSDALIELEPGQTWRGEVGDFVADPSGGRVRLTGRKGVSASPAGLSAVVDGVAGFEVAAADDYRGPGALLVEVTTATDPSGNEDPTDLTDGATALLSVPVQVGDDTPVLECPDATIPISQGEELTLDIASLCEVWTLDPADAPGLDYAGAWSDPVEGMTVDEGSGSVLTVRAAADATRGGDAVLDVRAGDSNTEQLTFRLADAPRPSLLPIRVEEMRAGESRTLDLAPYLVAGVSDPEPTVVSITQVAGDRAQASSSGSRITLRPGADAAGKVSFRVVMSDVSDPGASRDRRVEGRLDLEVLGRPGQPSRPVQVEKDQTDKILLGWFPPDDDGGSPVTHYEMLEVRSGDTQRCRTNECYYRGLDAGRRYVFKVRAVNKVGPGEWSDLSQEAVVDTRPSRVRDIRMRSRGNQTITLAWDRPATSPSRIESYEITWPGGAPITVPGDRESWQVTGLDNNTAHVFSITALNSVGYSDPRQSAPFQPLGTPLPPSGLTATDLESGNSQTTVRLSWATTRPEGPGPTLYTVYSSRDGSALRTVPGCGRIQATTCLDSDVAYDGAVHSYVVRASNQPSPEEPQVSAPSEAVALQAVGKPAAWGSWSAQPTGNDQEVRVTATAPDPRGAEGRAAVLVAGQVVWEQRVRAGATINEVVRVPSNDQPHGVQLRMCNENEDRGGCSSSDVRQVQSYGPLSGRLAQPTVDDGVAGSKEVTFHYSGTANGNPARVVAQVYEGGTVVATQTHQPTGPFSFVIRATASDFDTRLTVVVTLDDPDTAGRGSDTRSADGHSGPPPPPEVRVGRGQQCQDGTANPCRRAEWDIWGPCEAASCNKLVIHLVNWRNNAGRCWVSNVADGRFAFTSEQETIAPDSPTGVGWFTNGSLVEISCTAGGDTYRGVVAW